MTPAMHIRKYDMTTKAQDNDYAIPPNAFNCVSKFKKAFISLAVYCWVQGRRNDVKARGQIFVKGHF
jgi:hypothetical protein